MDEGLEHALRLVARLIAKKTLAEDGLSSTCSPKTTDTTEESKGSDTDTVDEERG